MFRWNGDSDNSMITPRSIHNPAYGFFYDKKSTNRNLSVADSEGISQFQISLVDHKNETMNVEYNPLDVFLNAKRLNTSKIPPPPIPPKRQNLRSGYTLYMREVRPIVHERNPDIPFGTTTKMVAKSWNELTPAEQEEYNIRAQNMPDLQEDYHNEMEQQNEFYGIRQQIPPLNQDNQGHSLYDINHFQN